ncbi:flagellar export chaperone FliS [Polymorphum gilvum]|uniref:Flagellar protein FliS n=1 Tax=Polymorphum gilvum (strain LMG 25793 / CGMCC 1.9160 / SL003B-26A1) TaxID=991905 RepID=F2J619_POLGS|nr:flagellar export chaperone FliS [Polymorphum gilvum]ADZ72383.1 hypothetical protein SL003B_3963 [Polymorphum gilvum SL003B-26A1]
MTLPMARAIDAYRRAATAVPPAHAVVLLYDEVVNALTHAEQHARLGRYDVAFERGQRAVTILRGLRGTLDMDRGGTLAQQLCDTYTRNIFAINAAIGKADAAERLRALVLGLVALRDAFAALAAMEPRGTPRRLEEIGAPPWQGPDAA